MSLTFISAGAGSGKTHTLMQTLSKVLSSGEVRPSGVMATTFTKKAATELRERVRQHLLADEKFVLANAMAQAAVGSGYENTSWYMLPRGNSAVASTSGGGGSSGVGGAASSPVGGVAPALPGR